MPPPNVDGHNPINWRPEWNKTTDPPQESIPAAWLPSNWNIGFFSHLQIWNGTSALPGSWAGWLSSWNCNISSPGSQAFWLRMEYIMGFPGSPAYWPILQILGLISLHNNLSQFLIINLLECIYVCVYINICTHTHILLILFMWRTLIQRVYHI